MLSAMRTAETLAYIERLECELEGHPNIDTALRCADVLRSAHRHLGGAALAAATPAQRRDANRATRALNHSLQCLASRRRNGS
jgi:hypothetical protein